MIPYASLDSKYITPTGATTVVNVGENGATINAPSIANGDSLVLVVRRPGTGEPPGELSLPNAIYSGGAAPELPEAGYSSVVIQYVMVAGQLHEVSRSIYDATPPP